MTVHARPERPVSPPRDTAGLRELDKAAEVLPQTYAALVAPDGATVRLPEEVRQVLAEVIAAMRAGKSVTVSPLSQRLTTQEAADLIGVSRPTLIKLLTAGEIPFETPGRHRRIRLDDVLAYRERRRAAQEEALEEITHFSEELGLYALDGVEGD